MHEFAYIKTIECNNIVSSSIGFACSSWNFVALSKVHVCNKVVTMLRPCLHWCNVIIYPSEIKWYIFYRAPFDAHSWKHDLLTNLNDWSTERLLYVNRFAHHGSSGRQGCQSSGYCRNSSFFIFFPKKSGAPFFVGYQDVLGSKTYAQ